MKKKRVEIEPVDEIEVWSLSEEEAINFFVALGMNIDRDKVMVRIIKHAPETEREKEKYLPEAKLYGIRERLKLVK